MSLEVKFISSPTRKPCQCPSPTTPTHHACLPRRCRASSVCEASSQLPAGAFSVCLQSPQHLSLYPQDVCSGDGGTGGGDRSLAHRHERAQVSCPSPSPRPGPHPLVLCTAHLLLSGLGALLIPGGPQLLWWQPTRKEESRGGGAGRGDRKDRDRAWLSEFPVPAARGLTNTPPATLTCFSLVLLALGWQSPSRTPVPPSEIIAVPRRSTCSPKRMFLRLLFP